MKCAKRPQGKEQPFGLSLSELDAFAVTPGREGSFCQWSLFGISGRVSQFKEPAADSLLDSRSQRGNLRMPTVRVTARARGCWVSPSLLTNVVREKPCPGTGAAKRPGVGAWRAKRLKPLSSWPGSAWRSEATSSSVDALREYLLRGLLEKLHLQLGSSSEMFL